LNALASMSIPIAMGSKTSVENFGCPLSTLVTSVQMGLQFYMKYVSLVHVCREFHAQFANTHDKWALELPILKNGFQQKCTRTRKSSELNHLIEAGYITRTNKTTNKDFIHYNCHQFHDCRPNRMLSSSDKWINISEMTCEPLTTMWLCDPLCSSIFAQHRRKVWNESWETIVQTSLLLEQQALECSCPNPYPSRGILISSSGLARAVSIKSPAYCHHNSEFRSIT
jgi:hypothetical protein